MRTVFFRVSDEASLKSIESQSRNQGYGLNRCLLTILLKDGWVGGRRRRNGQPEITVKNKDVKGLESVDTFLLFLSPVKKMLLKWTKK
jgi:hypothetical protein